MMYICFINTEGFFFFAKKAYKKGILDKVCTVATVSKHKYSRNLENMILGVVLGSAFLNCGPIALHSEQG